MRSCCALVRPCASRGARVVEQVVQARDLLALLQLGESRGGRMVLREVKQVLPQGIEIGTADPPEEVLSGGRPHVAGAPPGGLVDHRPQLGVGHRQQAGEVAVQRLHDLLVAPLAEGGEVLPGLRSEPRLVALGDGRQALVEREAGLGLGGVRGRVHGQAEGVAVAHLPRQVERQKVQGHLRVGQEGRLPRALLDAVQVGPQLVGNWRLRRGGLGVASVARRLRGRPLASAALRSSFATSPAMILDATVSQDGHQDDHARMGLLLVGEVAIRLGLQTRPSSAWPSSSSTSPFASSPNSSYRSASASVRSPSTG